MSFSKIFFLFLLLMVLQMCVLLSQDPVLHSVTPQGGRSWTALRLLEVKSLAALPALETILKGHVSARTPQGPLRPHLKLPEAQPPLPLPCFLHSIIGVSPESHLSEDFACRMHPRICFLGILWNIVGPMSDTRSENPWWDFEAASLTGWLAIATPSLAGGGCWQCWAGGIGAIMKALTCDERNGMPVDGNTPASATFLVFRNYNRNDNYCS